MALVAIAILVNLYVIGKKSVHQEIFIEASAQEVWKVLTDVDSIRLWNEVLIPLEGKLEEGETILYEFHQDGSKPSKMSAKVKIISPNELLNQSGGMSGLLTFDHRYMLKSDGKYTRLIIHEEYRGIAVPFWNPTPVEEAYGRLARALKARVLSIKEEL